MLTVALLWDDDTSQLQNGCSIYDIFGPNIGVGITRASYPSVYLL